MTYCGSGVENIRIIFVMKFDVTPAVLMLVSMQKLVVENMEVLTQMRTSFDKPDHMAALFKKLTCKHTHAHARYHFT